MTNYDERDVPPDVDPEAEPDPPEFDRGKVPESEYAEYFFDMHTGRGLTDAEYDETIARLEKHAANGDEGAIALLVGIRGRGI